MLQSRILYLLPVLLLSACAYTIKIRDGQTAHERRQYAVAIPMLKQELARAKLRSERGKLAFLLGDAYSRTGRSEDALRWFNTAYENNYGPDALRAAAFELKKLERYPEAREAFKNLGIEIGSPYEYRKELAACELAIEWKQATNNADWTLEAAPFNSSQNDFSPAIYADGQLVFTSDRAGSAGENGYAWTGNRFMDLFVAASDSESALPFAPALNTAGNEGTACFNADFTELFFVRAAGAYKGDDAYCKIYQADQHGAGWSAPRPLPFQKEKINYQHPALSADGNTLYFACNDPDGWGGYDLYSVQRNPRAENGWDAPRLLSRGINSNGNELFPYLDRDTLYFASDGLPGMGGLDIFRTVKMERNTWTQPVNLKTPINSGADDFGWILGARQAVSTPGAVQLRGYFTSNRPGGPGGDDIYRFEQRVPLPTQVKPDTLPVQTPAAYKMLLEVFVLEKIFARPDDPNSLVLGRRPLDAAGFAFETNGKPRQLAPGEDGRRQIELSENTDYVFRAEKTGYLTNSARFSTKGMAKDPANPVQRYELEIVLDKIYRDVEIVLDNIYYDYDKWDIRPDAEPTLNRLADVLKQNPAVRIQLGSHTDCRGNDDYNQELSQKRAQSAVNYLIGRGVAPERLSAVGYGETQPADTCPCSRCTEAQHQANRRTTFKVLE
jgi:outer membrane protein OmpA-like peptidoglycan-associated protein/tetratricopeptide (TPR) repeat protein